MPSNTTYLFIDGAYLNKVVESTSKDFFEGRFDLEIDLSKLPYDCKKIFYYDCLPAKRRNETEQEYLVRKNEKVFWLDALRELDGWHVYEGTIKGEGQRTRQKQVDIMIAVHMYTHTVRQNMDTAILLTGDLDFKPLLDALVMEGMNVTLWCEKKSTSKELIHSADSVWDISIYRLWHSGTAEFLKACPSPHGWSTPSYSSTQVESKGYQLSNSGVTNFGKSAYWYTDVAGKSLAVWGSERNRNYFDFCEHSDTSLLFKYIKLQEGITFLWNK